MKRIAFAALALAFMLSFSTVSMAEEEFLNVNTATQEELAAVPGLTAELAQAIVNYREDMGDFMAIDELADVPGMTKAILDQAKEKLGVAAVTGADCNC